MRRANDSQFLLENGLLLGINLGSDFTSEHEWGIKGIKNLFGIPSGEKDWGLVRRQISKVPEPPSFGWAKGAEKYSEGLYLWQTWDGKKPDFSKNSELRTWRGSLACAWDEKSFGVFSTDQKEIAYLKDIYEAFQKCDGAVFLGGGGPFQNSGLVLAIASRIPKSLIDGWYKADKGRYDIDQEVEKTGIRQLLKDKGRHYFALSPKRKDDGSLIYWLNPQEQRENNSGWFTLADLKEWAEGTGKIPMKKAVVK